MPDSVPSKPGRTPCLVPFCRRTIAQEKVGSGEWICDKHWRNVDRKLRWLMRRYFKRWQETRQEEHAQDCDRVWDKIRTQACERILRG